MTGYRVGVTSGLRGSRPNLPRLPFVRSASMRAARRFNSGRIKRYSRAGLGVNGGGVPSFQSIGGLKKGKSAQLRSSRMMRTMLVPGVGVGVGGSVARAALATQSTHRAAMKTVDNTRQAGRAIELPPV